MNYGDMQTEVEKNVIDVPPMVSDHIPAYINRAIKKLERKHNFYIMRASFSATTTEGSNSLGSVPDDFKDWRGRPYRTEDLGRVVPLVSQAEPAEAKVAFGISTDLDEGLPALVTRDLVSGTDTFLVWPLPDGNSDYSDGEYRITIPYWKFLADLSADGDSNWFTENAEEWVLYQATTLAFEADHDLANAQYWMQKAMREYAEIISYDKRLQMQGVDTLVPHTGMYGPRVIV